jgi:CMP-N-acetylneuraminic acid synthetase
MMQILRFAKFGIQVPFIRPSALTDDQTQQLMLLFMSLQWFENQAVFFDAVCLQVTSHFERLNF